ncbi:odorant receptor 67c-like [Leptopilina boulardi]|uniref:odorant receptor 67c-like n=1 Tax=Leptopilina boulardi TaxID=63433 RepID=UPI0021F5473E|nr:odorant receptor 67c-like [Leptopilina boulardi]
MVAEFSFKILTYLGVWRPQSLTSKWSIRIYNICTFIMLSFEQYFALTLIIYLFQNIHNTEIVLQSIFTFSSIFMIAFKVTYINVYREEVISFINMFMNKKCLPRNKDEVKIYKTLHEKERLHSRIFVFSLFFAAFCYTLQPLTSKIVNSLPIMGYLPFAINSRRRFWIAYFYQCISGYLSVILFASIEMLPINIMQQICIQLEFLMNRLLAIPNLRNTKYSRLNIYKEEYNLLKECINHHEFIFSLEKQLNRIFGVLISMQFFVSMLNLCTSGYYMTKVNVDNPNFWSALIILTNYISHIFLYCIFGEIMTRKSLYVVDVIYKMDWNLLSIETKQTLLILMIRASRPMKLTGSSLIIMSVETFLKILKTSYSAYNLLRNTNK